MGDMKKMVALSTLRQLGVIVTAIGVGFRVLAFFHLVTHAFFKALLFVRAGNLIHASESYQDMRTMRGSSSEIIPLTTRVVLSASISLCGLPFMSAFYSKEIIIEIILMKVVPFLFLWFNSLRNYYNTFLQRTVFDICYYTIRTTTVCVLKT